ncbi:SH3 domain-containing protein [Clostridium sp. AM58-1XD]|uniref:SH3 domain-containing protein n=1 Tax=Clostridium sp. AM58-1XD TaxID=2292307 RepID=UPI000E540790|nr:SH3 domain-containing protein [Clostridium sp. AM58-1XD]RGY99444.1 zinc-ribbon domain-containing protein [Clostridium sp. AM58-1XD]
MFCKKCGKQIADTTKFCPYCGADIKPSSQQDNSSGHRKPAASGGKNMKPFLAVCGVIIAVAIIATAVFVMKTMKSGAPSETLKEAVSEPEETETITTEAEESEAETPVPETTAPETTMPETPNTTQYPTYFVANCDEFITLRTEPDTSAAAILQIPYGSPVSYVETADNGFYKIIYNGHTGYGLASYLSTTQPEPNSKAAAPAASYKTYYVTNCDEWISLRKSPSTGADRITTIPYGAAVSFVENSTNGFYKIIYNGHTGYALASYLSTSVPASKAAASYRSAKVVNCEEWISLRVSPNTKADKYTEIPLGAYVTVISTGEANGFWKIQYGGYEGYALGQYLALQ